MLKAKFPLLISRQNFNTTNNNVICVNGGKIRFYSIFEHYSYTGLYFLQLFLYKYYRVVFVVKREQKQKKDYKFDNTVIGSTQ